MISKELDHEREFAPEVKEGSKDHASLEIVSRRVLDQVIDDPRHVAMDEIELGSQEKD